MDNVHLDRYTGWDCLVHMQTYSSSAGFLALARACRAEGIGLGKASRSAPCSHQAGIRQVSLEGICEIGTRDGGIGNRARLPKYPFGHKWQVARLAEHGTLVIEDGRGRTQVGTHSLQRGTCASETGGSTLRFSESWSNGQWQ